MRWEQFEAEMSLTLKRLKGTSMRVEDGGRVAKNRQLCDFLYWDGDGHTFAIECKATKGKSLPWKNIAEHQLDDLVEFSSMHPSHIALFAINYYDEKLCECVLIEARKLKEYKETHDRKSLHLDDALEIGTRLIPERESGRRFWTLRRRDK